MELVGLIRFLIAFTASNIPALNIKIILSPADYTPDLV
jgi:hypothetical protein